jgi:hypothetical protein
MFFRRGLISGQDSIFDPALRDAGDAEWMVRLLRRGTKMAALGTFTSVFTQTGANMSAAPNARRENQQLKASAPAWVRRFSALVILHHRLRRWLGGMYSSDAFAYEIYTMDSPAKRRKFEVKEPRGRVKT